MGRRRHGHLRLHRWQLLGQGAARVHPVVEGLDEVLGCLSTIAMRPASVSRCTATPKSAFWNAWAACAFPCAHACVYSPVLLRSEIRSAHSPSGYAARQILVVTTRLEGLQCTSS